MLASDGLISPFVVEISLAVQIMSIIGYTLIGGNFANIYVATSELYPTSVSIIKERVERGEMRGGRGFKAYN